MTTLSFTLQAPPDEAVAPATEGSYEHNPDHVLEGISHLIDFFRQGPRNQAVLEAVLTQVQEVEDAFWELLTAFNLDTATGDQLALLAKLVGEPTLDRSDDDLRAAVRARILINMSNGKPEELIAIALALAPTATIWLDEASTKTINLTFSGDLVTPGYAVTLESVNALMQQAKAAAGRINVIFEANESAEPGFIWGVADAVDLVTGWGSDTDAALGGGWAMTV